MSSRQRSCLAAAVLVAAALAGCGGGDSDGETDEVSEQPALGASQEFTVGAVGDIGMERSGRATLSAMGRSGADANLALGDLSYAGPDSAGRFCEEVKARIGSSVPFQIISGNHEEDTGEDGRIADFAACLPDRLGAVGEYPEQYYFDVGKLARFIMLAPDLTIEGEHFYYGPDDDGSDNANLDWLDAAIEGARENGTRWVIVGMHKNCISVGEYYCDIYQDLFTRLIESGVDLVISAHEHTYQRSKQISAPRPGCREVIVDRFDRDCVVESGNTYLKGAGTTFLISGAGGGELYRVNPDDPEAGYIAAAMGRGPDGRNGFASMEISPERLAVEFVGSTAGAFEDRFEIVDRPAGTPE